MGMSVGGGKGDNLNSEINVTPLVDVMLVLLIIFMVTAPMLNTGVDLELPQAVAANLKDDEGKLVLSIDKQGHIFLGHAAIKWAELEVKLSANQRVKTEHELYIEADQGLPYSIVVRAMAIAQKSGATKLMMLTNPLETHKEEDLDKVVAAELARRPAPPGAPTAPEPPK